MLNDAAVCKSIRDQAAVNARQDRVPPKRPRDPNQLAKSISILRTGQEPDRDPTPEEQGKDRLRWRWAKRVGKARAEAMTPERRAKRAAQKRWKSGTE